MVYSPRARWHLNVFSWWEGQTCFRVSFFVSMEGMCDPQAWCSSQTCLELGEGRQWWVAPAISSFVYFILLVVTHNHLRLAKNRPTVRRKSFLKAGLIIVNPFWTIVNSCFNLSFGQWPFGFVSRSLSLS